MLIIIQNAYLTSNRNEELYQGKIGLSAASFVVS